MLWPEPLVATARLIVHWPYSSCRIQCWVSAGKNLFLPDMSLNQFKLKKILVQWYLLCHSNMISSVSYKPNTEIQLCILNAVENCASVRLRQNHKS